MFYLDTSKTTQNAYITLNAPVWKSTRIAKSGNPENTKKQTNTNLMKALIKIGKIRKTILDTKH